MNTIPDKFARWDAPYVLGTLSSAERREFEEYLAALPDGRLGAGRRHEVLAIAEEWRPYRGLAATYGYPPPSSR